MPKFPTGMPALAVSGSSPTFSSLCPRLNDQYHVPVFSWILCKDSWKAFPDSLKQICMAFSLPEFYKVRNSTFFFFFKFFFLFLIEVKLIYNIVLVPAVQHKKFNICMQYKVLPTMPSYHPSPYDPLHPFCPTSTPFHCDNHEAVPCINEFYLFICFVF